MVGSVYEFAYDVPIVGIQSMTTIDFPDKLAAVFFTRGCSWQCRYCHNVDIMSPEMAEVISPEKIEKFLADRAGFLEGIVISGGEPTIHPTLPSLLSYIKNEGYATALHTNGSNPEMLKSLLKKRLVDFIAMDVKAPPRMYDRITGINNTCIDVSRSIKRILDSGVEYEFRTTFHPELLSESELIDTIQAISAAGAKRFSIQRFRTQGVRDKELVDTGEIITVPDNAVDEARKLFDIFELR